MTRPKLLLFAGMVLAAVATAGCQDKFSRQNYETVYVGMVPREVKQVLGRPDEKTPETWTYRRERPCEIAVIDFKDCRVTKKQWYVSEEQREELRKALIERQRQGLER